MNLGTVGRNRTEEVRGGSECEGSRDKKHGRSKVLSLTARTICGQATERLRKGERNFNFSNRHAGEIYQVYPALRLVAIPVVVQMRRPPGMVITTVSGSRGYGSPSGTSSQSVLVCCTDALWHSDWGYHGCFPRMAPKQLAVSVVSCQDTGMMSSTCCIK